MNRSDDLMGSTLQSLRIHGSVLLREAYAPPWMVTIPDTTRLRTLLQQEADTHIVAYHFVEKGRCCVQWDDGQAGIQTELQTGEMALCFGGTAHRLVQGVTSQNMALDALLMSGRNIFGAREPAPADSTSLICGVFMLHDVQLNPLFSALPPLLHTSLSMADQRQHLSVIIGLMKQEMQRQTMGSEYLLERFLEILCAEVIRAHAAQQPAQAANWLRGIRDPVISKAIACIHADPAQKWSVASLAEQVVMSPSRFAARFVSTLGEPPMTYVTKWRMHIASMLLIHSRREITQVAAEVGYDNVPAFHRAFKRHLGLPPAQWRINSSFLGRPSCNRSPGG